MTYQITLYPGEWEKKINEKTVRSLLRRNFPQTQQDRQQGLPTHFVEFQDNEDCLIAAEVSIVEDNDRELTADKLFKCFYLFKPEYESMVDIV